MDEAKSPRAFRPLKETLGAWIRGYRPEDEGIRKRTAHVSKSFAKWLGGGGFAIYFALRAMSLGERWLERTWAQTDMLTEKFGAVAAAMEKGADAQKEVAEGQKQVLARIDLLLGHRVEEKTAQEVQQSKPRFKAMPVGPSR